MADEKMTPVEARKRRLELESPGALAVMAFLEDEEAQAVERAVEFPSADAREEARLTALALRRVFKRRGEEIAKLRRREREDD